jgi:L-methionine (R)-S-oxide reductase
LVCVSALLTCALGEQSSDIHHGSNFSNTSALLWHAYHSLPFPSSAVNWAGFYFTDPSNPSRLILGPFQGQVWQCSSCRNSAIHVDCMDTDTAQVACQIIAFGRGVCGTAAATQTTQLVEDVEKFPGHIACDGASKSEIVVPIVQGGKVRCLN